MSIQNNWFKTAIGLVTGALVCTIFLFGCAGVEHSEEFEGAVDSSETDPTVEEKPKTEENKAPVEPDSSSLPPSQPTNEIDGELDEEINSPSVPSPPLTAQPSSPSVLPSSSQNPGSQNDSLSTTAIDRILESLEEGNIIFDAPQNMQIKELETVNLLLSLTESVEQLQQELDSEAEIESAIIKTTSSMEANLSGNGFKIEATSPQRQLISSQQTTKWSWEVMPTQSGQQRLKLDLYIYIKPDEQQTPYVLKSFEKAIEVNITPQARIFELLESVGNFAVENWEWSWTVIITPVGLWLWRRRSRSSSIQTPANPETFNQRTPTGRK